MNNSNEFACYALESYVTCMQFIAFQLFLISFYFLFYVPFSSLLHIVVSVTSVALQITLTCCTFCVCSAVSI